MKHPIDVLVHSKCWLTAAKFAYYDRRRQGRYLEVEPRRGYVRKSWYTNFLLYRRFSNA